jgi:hypothetical protein
VSKTSNVSELRWTWINLTTVVIQYTNVSELRWTWINLTTVVIQYTNVSEDMSSCRSLILEIITAAVMGFFLSVDGGSFNSILLSI